MEPITTIISIYIATKLVDQFISQEGYNWLQKVFFPKKTYIDRLCQLIEETAIEFEQMHPVENNNFPFYQSQPLFEILNEHILFAELPNKQKLLDKFSEYPNITPPTQEQLETFYGIFSLKISNCKTLKRLHIDETYKEKIFDISDEIIQIRLLLQSLDEKTTFHLTDDWLNEKNRAAIADLGGRYTPELNVQLEISQIFDGLGKTKRLSDMFYMYIDNFLIKGKKLKSCDDISTNLALISESLSSITALYSENSFTEISQELIDQICEHVTDCQNAISESESLLWKLRANPIVSDHHKYTLTDLRQFDDECNILYTFLKSITVKLLNNPFLLLEGDAGIGKSHLLADVIESRIAAGYPSLFLLGQQLTTDESPWVQILKRLQLKNTSIELLEKLNLYGQKKEKRLLIFIDAINEGNGNKLWGDNINSFIDEIKNFEWLGLIMSVRSTYKGITISDEQISRNNFEAYKHLGFKNVEMEAVSVFYDYYNIERPSSPNLSPEFKNPLFLKLLCEGIKKNGLTKIPVGFNGISKIFNFFVEGINKSLASPKKYGFDPSFRLVNDAINQLIKVKLASGKKNISLKDAHAAVQVAVQPYINDKTFLSALIDEGLLTKGIVRNEDGSIEEIAYISFERFDDHLTVKYLLDDIENIKDAFTVGGRLRSYFNDEYDFYHNQGIIEALSIQLPEMYGKELYELLPEFRENHNLINAFIDSLVWRKIDSIDFQKLKPFINKDILRFEDVSSKFFEMLVSISGIENHPFNANFLHTWLSKHSLPHRDAFWTVELKYKYDEGSTFRQLIDWAWSETDKSYVSDDSMELVATTLCWFLTSSNRELRDCTTKALVNLLEARIPIFIKILKKFKDIDDPYIKERIYAVGLGCAVRTKNYKDLDELSETVYSLVFDQENVYAHLLLRDYAREIIEYTAYLGFVSQSVDLSKIQPPYNSLWPETIPTKEELEKLYYKEGYWALWGSVMGEGDFARYIIGTNHAYTEWSGFKFGEQPISRKKLFEDFKQSLSSEQLTLFNAMDPIVHGEPSELVYQDTVISINTAIGRKEKKELLYNSLAFKGSLSEQLLENYESNIEPYLDHNNNLLDIGNNFDLKIAQRFIFNRVIELGWNPQLHGHFDRHIGSGRGRSDNFQERIGKKYQWIAYHEFVARLSDNFIRYEGYGENRKEKPYIGSWDPYERDIDPTILIKSTGTKEADCARNWWDNKTIFDWNCTFLEWTSSQNTITNPHALIEVKDIDGEEWLVLESHPMWKEPKLLGKDQWEYPRKEVWSQIRSYLIKSEDYEKFKEWLCNQHFMGRWMPESKERYEIFNREYYWSQAFNFFKSYYYDGEDWVVAAERNSDRKIADISRTTLSYHWEQPIDGSKRGVLSFLKPNNIIFDKMDLKYSRTEGEYVGKDGKVLCFSAEAIHDTDAHLLIRKAPFLKMLEDNNLRIVWTLLGEKGVIGGRMFEETDYGRLEFSGAFYLDNNGRVRGGNKIYS